MSVVGAAVTPANDTCMAMAPTQLTLSRDTLGGGIFNGFDAINPRDIEKLVHRVLFRIQEASQRTQLA
jgi:hypothetical protein